MPDLFSPADFMESEAEGLFSPSDFMGTTRPPTTSPPVVPQPASPGTIGGLINAAKRGWQSKEQGSAAVDLLELEEQEPSIRQERRAYEQGISDPNYARTLAQEEVDRQIAEMLSSEAPFHLPPAGDQSIAPQLPGKADQLYGPQAKLEQMMVRREAEKEWLRNEIVSREKKIQSLPAAEAVQAFNQAEGWEAVKAFAANPVEITANLIAESTTQSANAILGGVAGGAVAGPAGTALGGAKGAFDVEYAAKIVDSMRGAGIDLTDPEAIAMGIRDKQAVGKWEEGAVRRGVPIALLTMVGGALAGRFLGKAVGQGVGKVTAASGKELAEQSGLEALGEFSAQVVAGEEISPKEIFAEAIASSGQNVAEVGVNVARERALQGSKPPEDKPPLVEGVDYAKNMDPAARPTDLAGAATNPTQEPVTQEDIEELKRKLQENQIKPRQGYQEPAGPANERQGYQSTIGPINERTGHSEPIGPVFTPADFEGKPVRQEPRTGDLPDQGETIDSRDLEPDPRENDARKRKGLPPITKEDNLNKFLDENQEPAPEPEPVKAEDEETLLDAAIARVHERLKLEEKFSRKQLEDDVSEVMGGNLASGKYSAKDLTDILEAAINRDLLDREYGVSLNSDTVEGAVDWVKDLKKWLKTLPTQTTRTLEQDKMQQFSTPPPLAWVANWVAGVTKNDVVLEPSAGIGGLAVFSKAEGAKVIGNELSDRRAKMLSLVGAVDTVTKENAEYLYGIFTKKIQNKEIDQPTKVVMNPPFSNAANSNRKNTMVGARHVEEALKLLPKGGRLVAVVGQGMADDRPAFRDWWRRIKGQYNVRANVGVSGQEYRKYGTSFNNQLLVIDKTGPTPEGGTITRVLVDTIEELPRILKGIRDDAPAIEQTPSEPSGKQSDEQGESPTGGAKPVSGSGTGVSSPRGSGSGRDGGSLRVQPERREAGSSTRDVGEGRGSDGGAVSDTSTDGSREDDTQSTDAEPQDSQVESKAKKGVKKELSGDVFSKYTPSKVEIKGAQAHPTPLVESTAMASVDPPDPDYKVSIPKEAVEGGKLSEAQLESILYAGQAHEKILPNGSRQGFFIGDGTGVGKGREISGIILDNWKKGRKKAIWVSKNKGLAKDAARDLSGVGMDPDVIRDLGNKTSLNNLSSRKDGVAFVTYDSLKTGNPGVDSEGKLKGKSEDPKKKSRIEHLYDWLGPDFDGVIAFDEVHKAGNAVDIKGTRGVKKATKNGLTVLDLQRLFPKARIVYVSATGATEVTNYSYADRLGIWGDGTPFSDKKDFFEAIKAAGLSAMEIVARDLKAMGKYLARTLSFDGVKNDHVVHKLTPEQRKTYDGMASSWQIVLQNVNDTMSQTGAANNSRARAQAMAAFWGAQQRFFNQILTAMQMPSVLDEIEKDLANGDSVVLQLVNTNEAQMEREVARARKEGTEDMEDFDLSPKKILLEYLDKSYPTALYEEQTDADDNSVWVQVRDKDGNIVEDPEAVEKKERLIAEVGELPVPDNPMEFLMDQLGVDNIAEVTGRKRRIIKKDGKRVEEKRNEALINKEVREFLDDKRLILIFSGKGGTGYSYHADKGVKNQRRRRHYLVQAGWRADEALQGFGRTHRSNQVRPPYYRLVSTNLEGHKRFLSSVARRLAQLGALTGGERKAASQIFDDSFDLENEYAAQAVYTFFEDLYKAEKIGEFSFNEISRKMGYTKVVNGREINLLIKEDGGLNVSKVPAIQQFLNRILVLEVYDQNAIFNMFSDNLKDIIESAKREGTYDPGTQTLKAVSVKKVKDEEVYKHPESSAATRLIDVEVEEETETFKWSEIRKGLNGDPITFLQNKQSKNVYAIKEGRDKTTRDGRVIPTYRMVGAKRAFTEERSKVTYEGSSWMEPNYTELTADEAKKLWDEQYKNAPKTRQHRQTYVVGSFLPVWDRLQLDQPKVWRVNLEGGESFLGAYVPPKKVPSLKIRMGAGAEKVTPEIAYQQIMDDGLRLQLANGWSVRKVRVLGSERIEVRGPTFNQTKEWESFIGGYIERIEYAHRFFIPTEKDAAFKSLGKLFSKSPVIQGVEESVSYSVASESVESGTTKEEVSRIVDRITRKWPKAPSIQVVQSESQLPASYRRKARAKGVAGRIEGLIGESGTIWLVADNLPSPQRAKEVLAHEVLGHYGIEAVLGSRYDSFMLSVFSRYKGRKLLKDTILDYGEAMTDQERIEIGSEIVAKIAEGELVDAPLWRRVMDNVRRFFQDLFGIGTVDSEIRALLKQANLRVANGRRMRFSLSSKPGPSGGEPYVKGRLARTVTQLVRGKRGVLPKMWREVPLHGLHQRKAVESNIAILAGDLRKAVYSAYKDPKAREATEGRILEFLEGVSPSSAIGNPNVERAAVALRAYIDTLSMIIVKGGMVNSARAQTLLDNMGTWLRRSYLAFDPGMNWNYDELNRRQKSDPEIDRIWQDAESYLRRTFPDADDGEIEAFMRKLVDRQELESAFMGFLSGQSDASSDKVGMNLSSMMRRKEIPVELRAFMGEVRDPYYKVMESGKWMAQFIARFEAQQKMREIGLRSGLLSEKMTGRYMSELYPNTTDLVQKMRPKLDDDGLPILDAKGKPVMEPATTIEGDPIAEYRSKIDRRYTPLHGLYTTPQLKEALENEFENIHGQVVSWISALGTAYLRYVGLVKANLVGWNPYSWMVNIAGGFIMNLANGRVNPFVYKRAWDTVRHGADSVDGPLSGKQLRARMDRAMVTGAGVMNAGFFQEDLRNTLDREPEPHIFRRGVEGIRKILSDRKDRRGYKQLTNALLDLLQKPGDMAIQAPDNFQRVAAFLDELELSHRAFPGRTREQHILWAADRASNTYQTYDRLLPGLREFSRIGILNTFVSFKLELMRNIFWTARYAALDMKSSNRKLQKHGAKRAAGLLAVLAAPYFVSQMAKALHDIEDEDEEAIRTFLPPWDQADTLLWLGKDGTKYKYSAMSYLLPHVEAFRAVTAAMDTVTADDPARTLNQMLKGIVSDYFGPGAALGPILESTMKDNISRKEGAEGVKDRVEHWWNATLSPRLVRPIADLWKGANQSKGEWGKQYDIEDPLLKLAAIRVRSYDVRDQTLYKMREFNQRWRKAASNESFSRRKHGAGSQGAKAGADYAKEKKSELKKEYRTMVKHARQLGVSSRQISSMEKDLRVPLDLRD